MNLKSHIKSLRKKHAHLEVQIQELERSPAPCTIEIKTLKTKKLHLKQRIGKAVSQLSEQQSEEATAEESPPQPVETGVIIQASDSVIEVPFSVPAECFGHMPHAAVKKTA